MAIWQYSFILIPRKSVIDEDFASKLDEDECFEDDLYWEGYTIDKLPLIFIDEVLPKTKSWSKNLLIYGNEESNCFEVYVEKEYIKSISVRINFTSNYDTILRTIIEFSILNGLLILDEDLKVVPLNFESIKINTIENSTQVKKYNDLLKKDP